MVISYHITIHCLANMRFKRWMLRFKDGKKGGKRASLVIYNPETEYFPHPSMYVKK